MNNKSDLEFLADKLADLIVESERVIVFTGAGVSTESGIPDFRGPDGIWSKYDPAEFTYQKFVGNTENRKQHWKLYQSGIFIDENVNQPNAAHHAIAELYKMGKLTAVITQNVDNLHQKGGVPEDKVIELHGNMRRVKCLSCGQRYTMSEIMARVNQGTEDPRCDGCQGILKPETIFFGEAMPEKAMREATLQSHNCDLFIVIGSTLLVYPAAFMPSYAVEAGAKLAIINLTPTPMDAEATVIIRAKAGEAMSKTLQKVKEKLAANQPQKGG
jgi:NAD-dependent deacetylase